MVETSSTHLSLKAACIGDFLLRKLLLLMPKGACEQMEECKAEIGKGFRTVYDDVNVERELDSRTIHWPTGRSGRARRITLHRNFYEPAPI